MRHSKALSKALFLFLGVAVCASAVTFEWFTVTRVIDGDTIELENGTKVRLIGVDTPESVDPRQPIEYFGKEAAAFTQSELEGRRVRLEFDQEKIDKYGRTLAYVYQEDGSLFNAKLIALGYAHAYSKYPFKQEFMDLFRQLEADARENGRGLWGTEETGQGTEATPAPKTEIQDQEKQATKYWINANSGVRHNASCRWYGKTKNGYFTADKEGRACGICGG